MGPPLWHDEVRDVQMLENSDAYCVFKIASRIPPGQPGPNTHWSFKYWIVRKPDPKLSPEPIRISTQNIRQKLISSRPQIGAMLVVIFGGPWGWSLGSLGGSRTAKGGLDWIQVDAGRHQVPKMSTTWRPLGPVRPQLSYRKRTKMHENRSRVG